MSDGYGVVVGADPGLSGIYQGALAAYDDRLGEGFELQRYVPLQRPADLDSKTILLVGRKTIGANLEAVETGRKPEESELSLVVRLGIQRATDEGG